MVARGAALAVSLCAGACTGDLGRAERGVVADAILPEMGIWAAVQRRETVSDFALTDDEQQLRDRAWRFIMPGHERGWFQRLVMNLAHSRVLPVEAQSRNLSDYARALTAANSASQASRYVRLAEDANADRLLIAPFRANAARVVAADRIRLRALEASPEIVPARSAFARNRVVENEGLVLWVCERMRFRLESYRYALSNLVIEVPGREAVQSERAIMALEAEAGPMCAIPLIGVFGSAVPAPEPPPPAPPSSAPPVVYKG